MERLFIPNDEYHNGSGISNSALSELRKSAMHYWARYISPDRQPQTETPAMRLGTAVHSAILEPDLFMADYVQAPQVDRRTKEGKEAWASLPEHSIKLTFDEWNACIAMRDAVRSTPMGKKLLQDGIAEASYYVELHDLMLKCRPDWTTDDLIIDVKTTDDASPSAFERSAINWGYHRQAAFYMDVLEEYYQKPKQAFIFCVVEKSYPHAVAWYHASDEMINAGRAEYLALINTLKECLATDKWPAYGDEIKPLNLPAWYKS